MEKIKLTKNELKRQKDSLKRYNRYLPTLNIKKQQLQKEIAAIQDEIEKLLNEEELLKNSMSEWAGLFCEDVGLENLIKVNELIQEKDNIAGVDIPVLRSIKLDLLAYDLLTAPLWIDSALTVLCKIIEIRIKTAFFKEQKRILAEELRTTSQRVNLFEKIKIPESEEAIRKISIYLGDLQTVAVGWARIAKNKLS